MINYPTIYNIKEVLPVIEGKEKFVVLDRGDFTIIDYVSIIEGFPELPKNPTKEQLIERECRGIAFCNKTGNIISRPFEKFFNYMEKPKEHKKYTLEDFKEAQIFEKIDGSMIRPLFLVENGIYKGYRLMTRKGITDVAMMAESHLASLPLDVYTEYNMFFKKCYDMLLTPIFEFCSKENQVVVRHKEPKLVLLAVRSNTTGEYAPLVKLRETALFPVVKEQPFTGKSIEEFVSHIRALDSSKEGVVVYMRDGTKLKVKGDLYCQLHRITSNLREDRHYFDVFRNGSIDDLIPILDVETLTEIQERFQVYTKRIEDKAKILVKKMEEWIEHEKTIYNATMLPIMQGSREQKKEFHLWLVKDSSINNLMRNLLYHCFADGINYIVSSKDIWQLLYNSVKTHSKKAWQETEWVLQ